MKSILVKYLPATNRKGSRLKASDCDNNSVIISKPDHTQKGEETHFEATKALCEKMNWHGNLICGWLGNSSVWTFTDHAKTFKI